MHFRRNTPVLLFLWLGALPLACGSSDQSSGAPSPEAGDLDSGGGQDSTNDAPAMTDVATGDAADGGRDSTVVDAADAGGSDASDAGADAVPDAATEAATDAAADSATIDAAVEQPDGGPPVYVIASAKIGIGQRGVLADFDEDGKLDLAIAGKDMTGTSGAVIALGDGAGGFVYETTINNGTSGGDGIAIGDFNKDGHVDIVVAFAAAIPTPTSWVAFGRGNGLFQTPVNLPAGSQSTSEAASGDFNGDGFLDIVIGGGSTQQVCLNDRTGAFPSVYTINNGNGAAGNLAIGDIDGDGIADIVWGNGTMQVATNNGDAGTFTAASQAGTSGMINIALADLNGDGHPDVVANGGFASAANTNVLATRANGTYQPEVSYSPSTGPVPNVVDFDGDGKLDVVSAIFTGTTDDGSAIVFHGNGDGTLGSVWSYGPPYSVPPFTTAATHIVLVADVNKNGKPDIVMVAGTGDVGTLLR